jgi:hypothetical protein
MGLLGDEAQVDALLGPFGDIANLMQDRYTVCIERTTGSKNHLGHIR